MECLFSCLLRGTIFYVEGLRRQCIYVYLHYKICEKIKKDESFSNERVRGIRFLKICHKIISILITNLTIYHN